MSSSRIARSAIFLVLLTTHFTAFGQEVERSSRVEVAIAGEEDAVRRAEEAVRELLAPQDILLDLSRVEGVDPREVLSPQPDAEPALARVWIDLMDDEDCTVFLVESSWERVMVRRVRLENGIDAVALEEVGQIIVAAVETLLAGRPLDEMPSSTPEEQEAAPVEEEEPEQEPDVEQTTSEPEEEESPDEEEGTTAAEGEEEEESPRSFEFGIGYGVNVWSGDTAPLHGVEMWVELAFRQVRLIPAIRAQFAFRFSGTIEGEEVIADYNQTEIRAMASLQAYSSGTLNLRVGLGGGVDLLDVEPAWRDEDEPVAGLALGEGGMTVIPVIRVGLELGIRFSSSMHLVIGAAADLCLTDVQFTIERGGESQVVFDPYYFRPVLFAALTWKLM